MSYPFIQSIPHLHFTFLIPPVLFIYRAFKKVHKRRRHAVGHKLILTPGTDEELLATDRRVENRTQTGPFLGRRRRTADGIRAKEDPLGVPLAADCHKILWKMAGA